MKEKPKGLICFDRPEVSHSLTGKDLIVSSFTPAFDQDLAQATKWLQKAARQGHVEAKRLLGTILAEGKGIH